MVTLQWPWRRFTSGSSDFVVVVNRLKTRRDRDVLQHQHPNRMSTEYAKWFDQTGDWLLGTILRIWTSLMVPFKTFFQQIWKWGEWVRNLFHVFLTVEQTQRHLLISLGLRDRAASDSSFLWNVITGDEIWVYDYDPETRVQIFAMEITQFSSCEKSGQSRSNIKVMMIEIFLPLWNCASWVCTQEHYGEL